MACYILGERPGRGEGSSGFFDQDMETVQVDLLTLGSIECGLLALFESPIGLYGFIQPDAYGIRPILLARSGTEA